MPAVFKFRSKQVLAVLYIFLLCLALFFSGCINARVWGDNFFRNFLKGNTLKNKVTDKKVYNTTITGITAKDTSLLMAVSSIPILILFILAQMRTRRDFKYALSILVTLIERCESAQEIKHISSIFSQAYQPYKKLINNELRKFKS